MKNILLCVALLTSPASLAFADDQPAVEITLPADGREFDIVIVTHDDWQARPKDRMVLSWFYGADRTLTKLATDATVHHYTESDPEYKAIFGKSFGDVLPIVAIQDKTGGGIPIVNGDEMPDNPGGLVKHIRDWLKRLRPIKAIRQARKDHIADVSKKVEEECPDGQCVVNQTRKRGGILRRLFNRGGGGGDGDGGNDGVEEEPPLDESSASLIFPDYKAPIPTAQDFAESDAREKAEATAIMIEAADKTIAKIGKIASTGEGVGSDKALPVETEPIKTGLLATVVGVVVLVLGYVVKR